MLASGALWLLQRRTSADAGSDHSDVRRADARLQHLRAQRRAGVPGPLQPLAAHAHDLPHPHRRPGARAVARAGAARLQPPLARRRLAGRRVRAAVRPVPRLQAVLRALGASSAADDDEGDSDRQPAARRWRRSSTARARAAERPRRLHLRGRVRSAAPATCCRSSAGFERIVDGLDVPIIPVYLDRVWGSIFSFKGGRFFWKWPVRVPYPVTVAFGAPLPSTTTAAEARLALQTLGLRPGRCSAAHPTNRSAGSSSAPRSSTGARSAMADATTKPLTFGRALVGGAAAVAMGAAAGCRTRRTSACCCRRRSAARSPTSRLSLPGKVPVNLNFTAGREAMATAIERCGITTILTSRTIPRRRRASSRSTAWCSSKT